MRDQMDAMMWNAHHDQFSEWVDGGVRRLAARLSHVSSARLPGQLVAAVAALGLTLVTVGGSIV